MFPDEHAPPDEPVTDAELDLAEAAFANGLRGMLDDFDDLKMIAGPLVDKPGLLRELAGILESEGDSGREQRELAEQERLGKMVAEQGQRGEERKVKDEDKTKQNHSTNA